MTPTDRNNTAWTGAAADPSKPSILVRLPAQLLHQVPNEVTSENLPTLGVVGKHLLTHVASMTPQEHIQCAVHAVDAEYCLLGADGYKTEQDVAIALDVAWGPDVSALLVSSDTECRQSYYHAQEEGAEAVLAWYAGWRKHEIRSVGIQDIDKPAMWYRLVKNLLAPMRSGWEPADLKDD